jgi:5'-methylthioadenosine phosphorylase
MVTDYDCWKEDEAAVTVDEIVRRLGDNAGNAQAIVAQALAILPETRGCGCGDALKNAILTDRAQIGPEARERLRPIAGRYLD